jgi:hypothetical protein
LTPGRAQQTRIGEKPSISSMSEKNTARTTARSILQDVAVDGPVQFAPGERFWRVYIFRYTESGGALLEHRIYLKLKPDGNFWMVTFAVTRRAEEYLSRSGVAHVRDITLPAVAKIIDAITQQLGLGRDEYEEIDLSGMASLEEQLSYLANA